MTDETKKHDDSEEVELDFEPEAELGEASAAKAKMAKLRDELAAVKKERDEYLDGWQRSKADAANAKRDAALEWTRSAERARESLTDDLLPVLDGFDMAMLGAGWESVGEEWRRGIEYIKNQLIDVLSQHGIERYGKVGEIFDHAIHEALEERDDMPGKSGEIVRIIRHGYRSSERVIRPAQVVVKK